VHTVTAYGSWRYAPSFVTEVLDGAAWPTSCTGLFKHGVGSPLTQEWRAGWPHEWVWMLWRRENLPPHPSGNQNIIHHLSSPSLSQQSDYTIVAQNVLAFMSMTLKFLW
jgi:hypothetical protein